MIDRRNFLQVSAVTAAVSGSASRIPQAVAQAGTGDSIDLTGRSPDENGVIVPEGFSARVIARALEVVPGTDYEWPIFPDGGATFPVEDGFVYVANSEVPNGVGGVSALRFDDAGEVLDAYRILGETSTNCAGGATPWGTWLSCEEFDNFDENGVGGAGLVWECEPDRPGQGVARPAMGAFQHEAVAVDAEREQLYMTEDKPDGRLYRFTPASYPDLTEGALDVAVVDGDKVRWSVVPDPSGRSGPLRQQVPESTVFVRGEGMVADAGMIFFTTTGDNRVWRYDPAEETLAVVYDLATSPDGQLSGVDNITVTPAGELLVAEDGGNMELVLVKGDGSTVPIVRIVGEDHSELAGPAFDPSGRRLFFSSQRGGPEGIGVTFEVTGPFAPPPTTTTTTPARGDEGGDGTSWALPALGGAAAVLLGAAAVWRLRTRRPPAEPTEDRAAPTQ